MSECTSITECIVNTKIVDMDSEIEAQILKSRYSVIQLLAWYISYNMAHGDYMAYKYCTRRSRRWDDKVCNYMLIGAYAEALIRGFNPVTRSLAFRCSRINKTYISKVLKHFCSRYRCSYVQIDTSAEKQKCARYALKAYDGHVYSLEIFVKARDYYLPKTPLGYDGKGCEAGSNNLRYGMISYLSIDYIVNRYINNRGAEDFYCIARHFIDNTDTWWNNKEERDMRHRVLALGRDQWSSLNWDFCFPYDMQNVSKLWDCYWELYVKPNEFFKRGR